MTYIRRGSRLVTAGLIAACTAIGVSVATATAASASTAARASTSAHASASEHAKTTSTPARGGPSLAQLATLAQRAKTAAHASLAGSGAITGTIAGFDGQPVTGACVTAVGAGRSVTTTAAPDGNFQLAGLPAGSYALEYRDCASAGRYQTTWSGRVSWQSAAARVQVEAGQLRRVPAMTLRPVNTVAAISAMQASFRRALAANNRALSAAAAAKTGEVSGTVTGKGKPLSGICVQAEEINSGQTFAAETTKSGSYTIRHVAPGRYNVIFAPILFCPNRTNWLQQVYKDNNSISVAFNGGGNVLTVAAGHKLTGIDGNLRLGGEISGVVTGKSGARARGICVTAQAEFPHGINFGFGNQTAANGTYKFHAMFPGKYALYFNIGCGSRSENYAPVRHPRVTLHLAQHITVNQVLPTGASISGTVTLTTSSGSPLKGICVYASNASGSSAGQTNTNSHGGYRIIGLIGSEYQLQFFPGCANNGNYAPATLTTRTTAGQQTSNVNAVLQVGAEISGTIKNTGGNLLSGICIEVVGSNTVADYGGFDNDGSYLINQLSAGSYQLGFYGGCGNSGSYAPNWYSGQPSENTAASIDLTTAETFSYDVVMLPGATITGKVTNSSGNGVSGACVEAGSQFDAELGLPILQAGTATRRGGAYTLSNLAPGQYLVNFTCGFGPQRYAGQWFPDAPDAGAADLISAPAGTTPGINAVLQPAGSIGGRVTGQSGHPLAYVCVTTIDAKGTLPALRDGSDLGFIGLDRFELRTETNEYGYYRIGGLAAGRYRVLFVPCINPTTGYAAGWYRDKASAEAANPVKVKAGKLTSGINDRLSLGGSISGRVLSGSGKPLANICVIAAAGSANPASVAVTNSRGTYAVGDLPAGRYTVEFSPCAGQNLVAVVAHPKVTARHTTRGVDATLQPGGSVSGTVTAASSGSPVTDACVEVYPAGSAEPVAFGFTGFDGSYRASGLAAGSYQVYFGDPQCELTTPGLAPQWFSGQPAQAGATPVSVKPGATTPSVDAALQADGAITGTVSAGSPATPLSGACVTALPVTANGSLPVVAVTGADGYSLAGLLPGQYRVRFSAGCGAVGYATQWWQDAGSEKAATIITVVANQTSSPISATLSKS